MLGPARAPIHTGLLSVLAALTEPVTHPQSVFCLPRSLSQCMMSAFMILFPFEYGLPFPTGLSLQAEP